MSDTRHVIGDSKMALSCNGHLGVYLSIYPSVVFMLLPLIVLFHDTYHPAVFEFQLSYRCFRNSYYVVMVITLMTIQGQGLLSEPAGWAKILATVPEDVRETMESRWEVRTTLPSRSTYCCSQMRLNDRGTSPISPNQKWQVHLFVETLCLLFLQWASCFPGPETCFYLDMF